MRRGYVVAHGNRDDEGNLPEVLLATTCWEKALRFAMTIRSVVLPAREEEVPAREDCDGCTPNCGPFRKIVRK